ncbi:MAG: ATP-binding transporter protein [Herminiimonas sp.]|nr:ATP-binding transporter protein [Herminiimonas sp.]
MTILRTAQLDVALGGRRLISGLNWQAACGELWCVLGQNGVGKSSLLYVLTGLLKPAAGQVLIDGTPLDASAPAALATRRGLMPQQQLDAFSHTVLDTVLIGRTPYRVGRAWDSEEDRAAALAALAQVGLASRADADVLRLSGGERQRVALATLLVQAPELMLLDEPTAHQDVAQQLAMMRLIRGLAEKHAVVATCHDINLAARFASHVLVLAPGRHWIGPVREVLTVAVLEQAFGCHFEMTEAGGAPAFRAY